jgi:hypothetical protein
MKLFSGLLRNVSIQRKSRKAAFARMLIGGG